ncbi:cytochrome c551 [Paenibacillus sp. UNCCL117]|uniref:c-type cytochrome n=1 Tax=unclassified Paenibacillus TaxID=185978 RepID=UPI00088940B7|nr:MULTISPECIES: cytochrome c [unclassified Paenibacillus]SDD96923.1 cytochrome c551 [Paenibacillus sp. cl123]SFW56290.1 cytochrome c551 [Paenibacillus sp. UNCCL117]
MKRRMMVAVWTAALTLALAGCGGKSAGEAAQSAGQGQAAGGEDVQALYKSNCLSCHGNDLQGGMGPSLQKIGTKLTEEQIAAKVKNGGGGMPAYKSKLKEEEVQTLAAWLAEKK